MKPRRVFWGHWGMTFADANGNVYQILFPTGPQGPIDHPIQPWMKVAANWIEAGSLPSDAKQIQIAPQFHA